MNLTTRPCLARMGGLFCIWFAWVGGAMAKDVVLRNKDGRSLAARLVQLEGDALTVIREADMKVFKLELNQLDDASRGRVNEWIQAGGNKSENYGIEVSTSKSNKRSAVEDYDDRAISMEPVVLVKNPDLRKATKGGKLNVLFLGRPVNLRNSYYVFSHESFDLPSLEPGRQKAFQVKKFSSTYDNRGYAKYGSRYLGWVLLIHDEEDKRILHAASVPTNLAAKFGEKFLKLQAGLHYDADLRVMKYVDGYSE